MKVSVIVISWNSKAWIRDCLEGLFKYENSPVYVIDNGSNDGSVELIRNEFPSAHLISVPTNLGFGGANNLAMKMAFDDGCDAVFLLNNDTIIDQPFLGPLIDAVKADQTIGIIGPVVVEGKSPNVIQSRGGVICKMPLNFSYQGRGETYQVQDRLEPVDYVLGAAMLITKKAYERTNGFDEEYYPAYVEEADLCYRVAQAGFRNVISHRSRVRHLGELSSGNSERSFRLFTANRLRFAMKHLGPGAFLVSSHGMIWRAFAHKLLKGKRA